MLNQTTISDDEPFVREMCFGALRWRNRLQAIANQLLRKPFRPKDSDINWLLLLGLYQLLYLRTPDHAAIGETVEAARQLKKKWACAVLNGVLRGFQRNKDEILAALPEGANIQSAHPKWLTTRIKEAWPEHWQGILEQNNQQAPMSLRVNIQKTNREDYLQLLAEDPTPIDATPLALSPMGIQLTQACSVEKLPHFSEGWVSVQDEAAQLATLFLNPQANDRVLDACAAPGGKTCHILETCPELQEMVAIDISEARNRRVTENLNRLQLEATVISANIADTNKWWDSEPFDRILLDAPCSATGVIRRHPDIKWLRRESDIAVLAKQQLELLETCWQTLKVGGELLYSTCSILPDENQKIVTSFLAQQKDAESIMLYEDTTLGKDKALADLWRQNTISKEHACIEGMTLQLFPTQAGHDGFFYAKFKKTNG